MPKVLLSWNIPEFEKHKKSVFWYVAGGIVLLFLLIHCVKTANFLFAVILLMAAVIVVLYDFRESGNVPFALTSSGVKFGDKDYSYEDFARFWVVYDPPEIKKLYLELKSVIQPRLAVPLGNQDPNKIRKILLDYISEDLEEKDEPLTDYLGRVLKL